MSNIKSLLDGDRGFFLSRWIVGSFLYILPILSYADSQVYVLNENSSNITIIETATQNVLGTISFTPPFQPQFIVFSPDSSIAYVLSTPAPGQIQVVDTQSRTVIGSISFLSAHNMAITPDGSYIYLPTSTEVLVIDTTTLTSLSPIDIGLVAAQNLIVTPDGSEVYATALKEAATTFVSVIDVSSQTLLTTISTTPHGTDTFAIAVSLDGAYVYAGENTFPNTLVIETATHSIIDTLNLGSITTNLVGNPKSPNLYALSQSNYVSVIDTTTNAIVISVLVGTSQPGSLVMNVTPDGSKVYVCNEGNTISVIDAEINSVIATISSGTVNGVVFSLDSSFAYAFNASNPIVSVIDTATNAVIAIVPVGDGPIFAGVIPYTPPSGFSNNPAQEAAIHQALELFYADTQRSMQDIESTGLFPTFEGTYLDSINSYIIDSVTPFNLEVNIPYSWGP